MGRHNPTQPLPPDIREKVKTFLRLVTRPSTGETELAPEAPQVARNELEEPDNVSDQHNVNQLTFAIQNAVESSCATIGQPVPRLQSPDRAGPSIHIANGQRRLPCDPKPTTLNVRGHVEEIKQLHPLLMSSRAKLGENSLPQHNKQRRIVFRKQGVASFFRSEIVSKIRHAISSRRPDVLFEAMEGYPTSHAVMFFK
ncbi:hypothetical protein LPJ71_003848, partial [Coemansia sp. S17]